MNVLMLVCGMFIDLPAAVLLLTPVFVPLANAIGMDLTQLGIMMTVNLAIGLYTPPVGTTLFITSARTRLPASTLAEAPLSGGLFSCRPGTGGARISVFEG